MKANELRCGNYVNVKVVKKGRYGDYLLKEEEIIIVDSILDLDEYGGKINSIHDSWEYELKDVKPIPLTEEWLLKFGFEKCSNKKHEYNYINKMLIYNIYHKQSLFNTPNEERDILLSNDIKNVHQLQNLFFALIGEELTIKETVK